MKIQMNFIHLPLALFLMTAIISVLLCNLSGSFFTPVLKNDGIYTSNAFAVTEFLLPFFASACIIMQLGSILEKKTFEFYCTLPVKRSFFTGWLITMVILLLIHFITISAIFLCFTKAELYKTEFSQFCFNGFANIVFFCSAAYFLSLLLRRVFYVYSVLYGLIFVDLISENNIFGTHSLFVVLNGYGNLKIIEENRMALYIISLILIILSLLIEKSGFVKRMNKYVQ